MAGKRFRVPTYDTATLAEHLESSLRSGPLSGHEHGLGPGEAFDIDRHDGLISWRYFNVPQIMGFRDMLVVPGSGGFDRVSYAFCVLSPFDSFNPAPTDEAGFAKALATMQHAISHRFYVSIDERRKRVFTNLFEPANAEIGQLTFREDVYRGILTTARLRDLPRTGGGKLNVDKFCSEVPPYAFNGVVLPAFRAVNGRSEISQPWVDFGLR